MRKIVSRVALRLYQVLEQRRIVISILRKHCTDTPCPAGSDLSRAKSLLLPVTSRDYPGL